jgi:hypothetical protein
MRQHSFPADGTRLQGPEASDPAVTWLPIDRKALTPCPKGGLHPIDHRREYTSPESSFT